MEKNKQQKLLQERQEELETLFYFASPRQLRNSLHEVYAFYLQNLDITIINPDFNDLAMDFYFLHKFLEKAEKLEEKMSDL
jgi:hypothetical protein